MVVGPGIADRNLMQLVLASAMSMTSALYSIEIAGSASSRLDR